MRSRHTAILIVALLAATNAPLFAQTAPANSNGQTVLLDFTAQWCGYCRQMAPVVDSLRQAGYPVRTVDVDREPQLAAHYGATSLPCFVMVAEGREVDRVVGATSRERLLAMLAHARPASPPQSTSPPPSSPAGGPVTFAQTSAPAQHPVTVAPATQPAATPMPVAPMSVGVSSEPFRPMADPNASPRTRATLASASPSQTIAPQRRVRDNVPAAPATRLSVVPVSASPNADRGPLVSAAGDVDVAAVPRSVIDRALAASVRLRVEDPDGRSWGSGTIVDVRDGRALVVTCAHIFRESGGDRPVTIDLFGDDTPKGLVGKVLNYDLPSDVALVAFDAPGDLAYMPVAPATHTASPRDAVVSVGCGHGTMPTAIVSRVVSIDRFLGAPNLQVAGQPVQGRSGGGLFSADGHMIGVCNAADPQDDQGLYAALGAIQAELDRSKLSYVYAPQNKRADILLASTAGSEHTMPPAMPQRRLAPAEGGPVNTAAHGAAPPITPGPQRTPAPATPPPLAQPPVAQSPVAKPQAGLVPVTLPQRRPAPNSSATTAPTTSPAAIPSAAATGLSPAELGALDAIERAGDGAEVIVIVRSRSDPTAKSQIIVLDHASPTLLDHLSAARPGVPPQPGTSSRPPASQLSPPVTPTQQLVVQGQPAVARR